MANIIIVTMPEEQEAVLKALRELDGKVTPVAEIARMAGLGQTRARYVLLDLQEAGKIERVAHKAFNKHYVRYSYIVK